MVDREAAYQGGLGWFGKNANLLLPGAGSWFVLGSVVTTAAFEPAPRPVADGCGACRRCIDACPTGAIVAPGVIDANRCLAWVLQRPGSIPEKLRAAVGDRVYGCDDCQDACPPTVRLGRRHAVPLAGDVEAWVGVLELLDADDEALLQRHGRWYIAGRDPRWLRRNALVVLGNVGTADDPRTLATLARYRNGPDELLADHARWASERLGLAAVTTAGTSRGGVLGSVARVKGRARTRCCGVKTRSGPRRRRSFEDRNQRGSDPELWGEDPVRSEATKELRGPNQRGSDPELWGEDPVRSEATKELRGPNQRGSDPELWGEDPVRSEATKELRGPNQRGSDPELWGEDPVRSEATKELRGPSADGPNSE